MIDPRRRAYINSNIHPTWITSHLERILELSDQFAREHPPSLSIGAMRDIGWTIRNGNVADVFAKCCEVIYGAATPAAEVQTMTDDSEPLLPPSIKIKEPGNGSYRYDCEDGCFWIEITPPDMLEAIARHMRWRERQAAKAKPRELTPMEHAIQHLNRIDHENRFSIDQRSMIAGAIEAYTQAAKRLDGGSEGGT